MILGASGENIYPEEIESVINNIEGVTESIVVERNGRLVALVQPIDGFIDWDKESEERILEKLPRCKWSGFWPILVALLWANCVDDCAGN